MAHGAPPHIDACDFEERGKRISELMELPEVDIIPYLAVGAIAEDIEELNRVGEVVRE